ncbi:MAG: dienelactone hydrolase family protein [Flavobacteriaceae bacterium]|nr:dienelactone hydrolase family protein [Flavobacteriaceae bacterium]
MDSTLHYISREPSVIDSATPLLILIHGYGSSEEDLFSFESQFDSRYLVVSVQAPLALPFGGFAWYSLDFDEVGVKMSNVEEAIQAREQLLEFITEIQKKYQISSKKTVLMGFSQGAILSYSLALTYPDKVQKIVALSGYLFTEIIENRREEDYQNIEIFASHGSVDQVVPIELARQVSPYLKAQNISYICKEYPVGHNVAPQNFFDAKKWIDERILND